MYNWLRREFEDRSVAEMSIWYSITAVGSFIVVMLLWGSLTDFEQDANDNDGISGTVIFLTFLSLWLVFLLWLWVGMIRTVWKWGSEKLGVEIFKYLQRGFLIFVFVQMIPALFGRDVEFKMISGILLVFDAAIACMTINFLFLAWFARCRIPLRTYLEIGSIILMVVIQAWIIT